MHPNNELKLYTFLKKKDAARLGFRIIAETNNNRLYTYKGHKILHCMEEGECGFFLQDDEVYLGETYGDVMNHFKGAR